MTEFLHANVFDGIDDEGKPVLNRPWMRSGLDDEIKEYLRSAPLVVTSEELGVNAFTGERDVPSGFHTDGTWVWPSALPFYMDRHSVDPEPALEEHIDANDYEVPEVSEEVRRLAAEAALDPPKPQVHLASWEDKYLRGLKSIMRHAGVGMADYQLLESLGPGHSLMLREDRLWELTFVNDDSRGPTHYLASSGDLREVGRAHLKAVLDPEKVPETSLTPADDVSKARHHPSRR